MGIAQGMDIVLDLAERLLTHENVGFALVGRGSELTRLRQSATKRSLTNVHFFDEIEPDEIPDLYSQCHIGVVALDSRHKSHNIPGKFLTYMQNGLPTLAVLNQGNDLADLIRQEQVGEVCDTHQVDVLTASALRLLDQLDSDKAIRSRCRQLFDRHFSAEQAVHQIVAAISPV